MTTSPQGPGITATDVKAAADRIARTVRRVAVTPADPNEFADADVWFAHEYLQHSGTFKARGAANLAADFQERHAMPEAGIAIASGGNAAVACAWAAQATGTRATVFVPETTTAFKLAKLLAYGADVHQVGTEYAHALEASIDFARQSGAFLSHAYDHPLVAAGAGTCALEILAAVDVDTLIVAAGGGGLFSGFAAAVEDTGVKVVVVEPEGSRALNAALEAGGPVDVSVDSVAGDSLGARRVSQMAYEFARRETSQSVLVTDAAIVEARRSLWTERRIVSEHGGAAALAALRSGAYVPQPGERVAVVLCGANTDPSDLVR